MEERYTDLETSKQLQEWGCRLGCGFFWTRWKEGVVELSKGVEKYLSDEYYLTDLAPWSDKSLEVPAYDLIWDCCIRYPKEFFGDRGEIIAFEESYDELISVEKYKKLSIERKKWCIPVFQRKSFSGQAQKLFLLVQSGKYKKANQFLLENTIFNPKNQ